MNFPISSLLLIVYFLPVNGANYMGLIKNRGNGERNVADLNPKTKKTLSDVNIFVNGNNPLANVRKSLSNNLSERDLNKILRGYKLEDYLSKEEIHEIKVKEVIDFIQTHYVSAEYFYDEMRRIISQHEVKDDLRNMVTYFEENPHLKKHILDAYEKIKVMYKKKPDIWSQKPNNLAGSLDASWYI